MLRLVPLVALSLAAAAPAQEAPGYSFRERTRALAFDAGRFFAATPEPMIAIRSDGDTFGLPLYALALRPGCNPADSAASRADCSRRIVARMVRAILPAAATERHLRGQRLFTALERARPDDDDALRRTLDSAGLEWVEADVRQCAPAMAHLATLQEVRFVPSLDLDRPIFEMTSHADQIRVDVHHGLVRSRYEGWAKPGTAGAWASDFAKSLEGCWKPATAPVPWRVVVR
ncbi:hypothetical protein [uncultured Sphingomonas sp.]|uniref:hypothetical protein n=1 Tax=uncultured Sphingomonas sp. TaxID=158754 RepID=UPI0025F18ECD|nr:hypothetical protein [uncultured Sphingomonas sp.]